MNHPSTIAQLLVTTLLLVGLMTVDTLLVISTLADLNNEVHKVCAR